MPLLSPFAQLEEQLLEIAKMKLFEFPLCFSFAKRAEIIVVSAFIWDCCL
jgi:hypothetical protein